MKTLEEVLEHHGIKGMKWGVRRGRNVSAAHPPSEDHAKARAALAKAKTSGSKSLSNEELQTLTARINLEQQYSKLNPKTNPIKKGQKAVIEVLAVGATVNAAIAFAKSPAGQAMAKNFKK